MRTDEERRKAAEGIRLEFDLTEDKLPKVEEAIKRVDERTDKGLKMWQNGEGREIDIVFATNEEATAFHEDRYVISELGDHNEWRCAILMLAIGEETFRTIDDWKAEQEEMEE